eukprot:355395-Prymnesium_polylepis.1
MSLLSAFASNVRMANTPFGARVDAVLEREGVMTEPVVAAASEPLAIAFNAPEPEPEPLPVLMEHAWGQPFPVNHGGPTVAHHQECLRCNA